MSVNMEAGMDQIERRQSHVMKELDQQSELVTAVHQAITELEQRLSGILRSEDTAAEKVGSEPHVPLVAVAEKIHEHNNSLQLSSRRLFYILDRLEL